MNQAINVGKIPTHHRELRDCTKDSINTAVRCGITGSETDGSTEAFATYFYSLLAIKVLTAIVNLFLGSHARLSKRFRGRSHAPQTIPFLLS